MADIMQAVLKRSPSVEGCTLGGLIIPGHKPFATLELPWLDNKPRVSCIPAGDYKVKPHNWEGNKEQRFARVWEVTKVPGRSAILFHVGNTSADILGCILVGMEHGRINKKPAVLQSKVAINLLREIIGKNGFMLEIKY